MRKINEIILHCTATEVGKSYTVYDIDRWHKQRGFMGIGYHYVIYIDGTVHKGRNDAVIGAHCSGHNANSIGVAYVGGLLNNKPFNTLNYKQIDSLRSLLARLMQYYRLDSSAVHLHSEYANKACPCFTRSYMLSVLLNSSPLMLSSKSSECRELFTFNTEHNKSMKNTSLFFGSFFWAMPKERTAVVTAWRDLWRFGFRMALHSRILAARACIYARVCGKNTRILYPMQIINLVSYLCDLYKYTTNNISKERCVLSL